MIWVFAACIIVAAVSSIVLILQNLALQSEVARLEEELRKKSQHEDGT